MPERTYRWMKPALAAGLMIAGVVRCPCGGVSAWVLGGLSGFALYVLLARRTPVVHPQALASCATWAMLSRAAADEVLWRGWLSSLSAPAGQIVAVVISVVGFALTHHPRQGSRGAVTHLLTGSVFAAIMLTVGLLGAVVAHGSYNVLVVMGRMSAGRVDREIRDAG
ncbi:MAG TPA: CPBP family intramembrane glutamic endopeptidase [bacterium]